MPRSSGNDLTYDQTIEVMEWLDSEGEMAVSDYFHSQLGLHALAESFEMEFVRNWPSDRKLRLWDAYERFHEDTLGYAKKAQGYLDAARKAKRSRW